MKKKDCIRRYGKEEWNRRLKIGRDYNATHKEEKYELYKNWCIKNPSAVKRRDQEKYLKSGRYYKHHLEYSKSGIPGGKHKIRGIHAQKWRPYKKIIAPDSEVHHSWLNDGTADYLGMALVEKNQHRHGIIDVIEILEGKITLFTEKEIREQKN